MSDSLRAVVAYHRLAIRGDGEGMIQLLAPLGPVATMAAYSELVTALLGALSTATGLSREQILDVLLLDLAEDLAEDGER